MKKLKIMSILIHLIITLFTITTFTLPVKSYYLHETDKYIIMHLNNKNQQDVAQVLDIFKDEEVQEMTNESPENIENQINNNVINMLEHTIIVYKDTTSKKIQGVLISCLEYHQEDCQTYVITIAIHKNFRRKNVASILLWHAEEIARSNGCQKIYLSVYHHNYKALKCYEKHGFSITADLDDYIVMSKQIIL